MTRIRQSGEATMQQRMDGGAIKLSTFIPLQIRKRGVRKVMIRPDRESASPTARGQFASPMLVALARAFARSPAPRGDSRKEKGPGDYPGPCDWWRRRQPQSLINQWVMLINSRNAPINTPISR